MTTITGRLLIRGLAGLALILACAAPALAQESLSAPTHSISVSPNRAYWGQTTTATVTLTSPAGSGGQAVGISLSRPLDFSIVGDQVKTIPQGQTSTTFQIRAVGENRRVGSSAQIYANMGGISRRSGDPECWVRVYGDPLWFRFTLPSSVTGAATINATANVGMVDQAGTVYPNRPVPSDLVITLTPVSGFTLPASVTIPAGAMSSPSFQIRVPTVTTARTAVVTGRNPDGFEYGWNLTLQPLAVSSVAVNPPQVPGMSVATGTVTLNGPAGPGGFRVGLKAYGSADVPGDIMVNPNATSATFPVMAQAVSGQNTVRLDAWGWIGPNTIPANPPGADFRVVPGSPPTVSISDLHVSGAISGLGGRTLTGEVRLSGNAPSGGAMVGILREGSCCLEMPALVTVAAGSQTATFSIATYPTAEERQPKVTARYGGQSKQVTLTVLPPDFSSFARSSSGPVYGPSTQTMTLTVSGAAPVGGLGFTFTSSDTGTIPVPATVRIPEGQTSVTFPLPLNSVTAQKQVLLVARGPRQQSKDLTLNVAPAPLTAVQQRAAVSTQGAQFSTSVAPGTAGGSGGSPFSSDCGSDGAVVGIKVRTGTLVDSVQAVCSKVNTSGAWVGNTFDASKAGGSGGSASSLLCDSGWGVTGVFGKAGSLVDSVGVKCGKLGASSGTVKVVSGSASRGPAGGGGGSAFDLPCGSDRVAKTIGGRAGSLVDQISVSCHNPTAQPAATTGGGGGSPFTSDCGSDAVMIGIKVRTGTLVDSVQAVCIKASTFGGSPSPYEAAKAGGSGGSPSGLICDVGSAVTGLFGKAGSLVDSIGVKCGKLGASNNVLKVVSGAGTRGPAGGGGGSAFDQPCGGDKIAKGLTGRAGTLIDQISVSCHNPTAPAASKAAEKTKK